MWTSRRQVRKSENLLRSYRHIQNNIYLSDVIKKKSFQLTGKEPNNKNLKSIIKDVDKAKYKIDQKKNESNLSNKKSKTVFIKFSSLKKKIQDYFLSKSNKLHKENRKKQENIATLAPEYNNCLPVSHIDKYESVSIDEEFETSEEEEEEEEEEEGEKEICSSKEQIETEDDRRTVLSGYFTPVGIWTPLSYRKYHDWQKTPTRHCCISTIKYPEFNSDYNNNDVVLSYDSVSDQRCKGVPIESGISTLLDEACSLSKEHLMNKFKAGKDLYPNCDTSIWMRSCEQEVVEPLKGTTTGFIPRWLKGTLLRNGPGGLKVGDMTFLHLFDSSALLHRFGIDNGEVTYQCRYLKTKTFQKNHAANRIVVSEFGTKSMPDPCKTIFQRVSAMFNPGESMSDNANISVYPFGDEFYAFTESTVIHRIDPVSLDTLERVNMSKHIGIVNHSSHPHVMSDGTVFNQGMTVQLAGPSYSIIKFPLEKKKEGEDNCNVNFNEAQVMASVKARWPLHPSYMHTFGITENYFIIVEQPLSISVPTMIKCHLNNDPFISVFRFYKDKHTLIHAVNRKTGKQKTFAAEAFFFLHIINQYEEEDHLVIDICCYSDPSMLDCMYIDALKNINKNPNYARMFRARPLRFVLPLGKDCFVTSTEPNVPNSTSKAFKGADKMVTVTPELLCNMGCETPRINYSSHLGKPYRYFYAISSDVDLDNPGTLIKVDTWNGNSWTWCETGLYPSEPIFVSSPDPQGEDDGVVLSALVWGKGLEKQVGLIVLDARDWREIGRTVFHTPGPVPKCLHGWFTPNH